MTISLKDFKYPGSWNTNPNINNQYFEKVFEDSSKVGIYELNNPNHFLYMKNMISICSSFYPTFDNEQLILCGNFIHWLFLFDDFLEDEENTTSEKQNEILRTHEQILFTGQFINNDFQPKPLEKLTMLIQKTSKEWAIKYNKMDIYNLFLTTIFQWLYSVYPLNKTSESIKAIHMDLYSFIRKVNSGVIPTCAVVLLVDKEINNIDISKIWLNPIFTRIMDNLTMHVALVNDYASYSREINVGVHKVNPFYFLQMKGNLTFDDIFKFILKKCDDIINQIIKDEEYLLKQLKEQGYTPNQLNQVNKILNYNHYIIQGNINWSKISKRYNNIPDIPIFKSKSNYL
ncbi:hypothetical protein ACTA71_010982 [Dictyostelium dimigraforme]